MQSNIQASVADVIVSKMNDGELDAGKTPLLGLDRVQEFRSPAVSSRSDYSGYREEDVLEMPWRLT